MSDFETVKSRFMGRVFPDLNSGCWLWTQYQDKKGYGHSWAFGKTTTAHRLSWVLHFGDIPGEMHVLHKCDNPSCVNPNHLFLGTNKDNVRDRVSKGRSSVRFGEKNWMAVCTMQIAEQIRQSPLGTRQAAEHFGVSKSTILRIRNFQSWVRKDD